MKFFVPFNFEAKVVRFYLKFLGRNVEPVDLEDFLRDPCEYLGTGQPMTFAVEVLLSGNGWERTQHVTLCYTGRDYTKSGGERFASVVQKFVANGPPKTVTLLGLHFLGNQMMSLLVLFPQQWHRHAASLYFENGVPEGNERVQGQFGLATYHVSLPFFLNGGCKYKNEDLKQAQEKSPEAYCNEKSFYEWLGQMVMALKKDFPLQWENLHSLPDLKTDTTAAARETEALEYVSKYLKHTEEKVYM